MYIKKFCSIGPKCYSFILSDNQVEIKAKGFPKYDHNISYELFKSMVLDDTDSIVHKFPVRLNFVRNKFESSIKRTDLDKSVKKTYDKRIILDNLRTRPFGTKY